MPTIITVEIDEQGDAQVSVKGAPGPQCKKVTEGLENALGTVVKTTPTPEMTHRASTTLGERNVAKR